MYRIFHGKHLLLLCKKSEFNAAEAADFIFKKPKEDQIKEALRVSKRSTKPLTIVFIGNPDKTLGRILNEFKLVEAAGGVVLNKHNDILSIKRLGKWDLPKGKIKKGESLKTCAMREVEEETGVSGLKVIAPLTETYHTYYRAEKWIIKKSHWFIMSCSKGDKLVPQIEEDIEEVKWMPINTLDLEHLDTYPAITWILREFKAHYEFT